MAAVDAAKEAVKAAYEQAMKDQIAENWPVCAAGFDYEVFMTNKEGCKMEAKAAMEAEKEDAEEDSDDVAEEDSEDVEVVEGGKKDKNKGNKKAVKEAVKACMSNLGYDIECLDEINEVVEQVMNGDEEESEIAEIEESESNEAVAEAKAWYWVV